MSFKHKKKFGQNFLTDQKEVLRKIMEVSDVNENDTILEIGPGEGALTALLLDKAQKVVAVEIDRDLEKILRKKFKNITSKKETIILEFNTPLEVLRHLKNTGVTGFQKTSISKIRSFSSCTLTYEISYFICKN